MPLLPRLSFRISPTPSETSVKSLWGDCDRVLLTGSFARRRRRRVTAIIQGLSERHVDLARGGGGGGFERCRAAVAGRIRWKVHQLIPSVAAAIIGRCSEGRQRPSENTLVLNFHEGLQSGAITSPASRPQLNRWANIFTHRCEGEG